VGWTRWPITAAHPNDDLYALNLVGKFIIRKEYDGEDYDFEGMKAQNAIFTQFAIELKLGGGHHW